MLYDCMVIGGGIAGLQAAIQLGRYQYKVIVIDSNKGRSNLCRCYHNLLGWPDGVSGQTLRDLGKHQAEKLGVLFIEDTVTKIKQQDAFFLANTQASSIYKAKRLLLATGVKDNIPPFTELYPCLGISIFVCPDCDGYEIINKHTLVIGSGNVGASMAISLIHWSPNITYINHGQQSIDEQNLVQLKEKQVTVVSEKIKSVQVEGSNLHGITLENGQTVEAAFGFLALGGNIVNTSLAEQIGVECLQNKHIQVDPRTKMTNIPNVWAAGDIVAHSEQVAIAMGDGLQAAIWMHKSLIGDGIGN
ncbi:NAD(P)/FAD-dependent oxidoreductase [Sutcliffiella halmapala]|uniref:NAD(P)/FAD-dependent oxidoreductase n=1 Tax=Sutcliffiella halmapala TaxID=79882 RepID=UPI0009952ADB|nr:NAD(P)/FAD-dependent oxidoreductase [Sutcliffiella halmapala]